MAEERKKLTVPDLVLKKRAGEKVVMASIPDYPTAVWAERAGIDIAAAARRAASSWSMQRRPAADPSATEATPFRAAGSPWRRR